MRADEATQNLKAGPDAGETSPRTAMLHWFCGAFFLALGIAFLILPRGPINPLYGLVWFRGPALCLSGLAVLWLAVLNLTRRQALVAHILVAVPPLAVAIEYVHLQNYAPAISLLLLAIALALTPLAPRVRRSRGFRPDALGVALGLALGAQGLELLSTLAAPAVVPYGLQEPLAIVFVVFGFGTAASHLVPRVSAPVRWVAQLGAGAAALALWVILGFGYGALLLLLNISGLIVAAAFIALPWLSGPFAVFAPDTTRTRVAGQLFTGALVPLLIALPLVLSTPSMQGQEHLATRQLAFGVAVGLSIAAGVVGWFLAQVLADHMARLVTQVEAVARGVRPVQFVKEGPQDVQELAVAVQTMAGALDDQMEALKAAGEQHKSVADKLQRALQVPLGAFPELEVAVVYQSASDAAELGGDFYDVFRIGAGRIGVLIGDVSGRGLDAAAQAVLTRASLRAFTYSTDSPAKALEHANRLLIDSGPHGFVTVFLGILDPVSASLLYSVAGHPPPVVISGGKAGFEQTSSPVLGVFETAAFRDGRLDLSGGRTLLLYTDGLTEAKKDGALFGESRLLAAAESLSQVTPAEQTRRLYTTVVEYAGGGLADDIAVLALRLADGHAGYQPEVVPGPHTT